MAGSYRDQRTSFQQCERRKESQQCLLPTAQVHPSQKIYASIMFPEQFVTVRCLLTVATEGENCLRVMLLSIIWCHQGWCLVCKVAAVSNCFCGKVRINNSYLCFIGRTHLGSANENTSRPFGHPLVFHLVHLVAYEFLTRLNTQKRTTSSEVVGGCSDGQFKAIDSSKVLILQPAGNEQVAKLRS